MDPIKKNEEIRKVNESIFGKIFNKFSDGDDEGYLKQDSKIGYYLNNNYVRTLDSDYSNNPYLQHTWSLPEYEWLINSTFQADVIKISRKKIEFSGDWYDGIFEGLNFYGKNSTFGEDGIFNGEKYSAPNKSFKAPPENFIKGAYVDCENGVLGKDDYDAPQDNVKEVELIRIKKNWNISLIGEKNKKLYFKILKKIDENSADFILQPLNAIGEEQLLIPWEQIRSSYEEGGFIRIGQQFGLMGDKYFLNNVKRISIVTKDPEALEQARNVLDFSLDKRLKNLFFYKGNSLKFEIFSDSIQGIENIKKLQEYVSSGNFHNDLEKLRFYIKSGEVNGYSDEKWIFLKPVFNGVIGKKIVDEEISGIMERLNNIIKTVTFNTKIIKESKTNSIFVDIIKKALGVGNEDFSKKSGQISGAGIDTEKKAVLLKKIKKAL